MLTSTQNPLVKQFRKLHQAKERKRQRTFLLEGSHLIIEACAAKVDLQAVCFTQPWHNTHPSLVKELLHLSERAELVSDEVLKSIATTVNPDGVVAIAHPNLYEKLHPDFLAPHTFPSSSQPSFLGIAVETLQDPGNLGTIIRTSAAVGLDQLWIGSQSVEPTHPKVLRASAGQWFRVPMCIPHNLVVPISALQHSLPDNSLQVIATCPDTELSYWDIDYTLPTLILVGNEGAGLSNNVMAMATHKVQIPLAPNVESLNAAIATALVLYEAKRQRRNLVSKSKTHTLNR